MSGKFFFIDTTRCTACRGCQVACKEWNKLSADETHQWGSPQNPPDLDAHTYRLVRFREHQKRKTVVRYFFSDACRHCLEPYCKEEADQYERGAIIIDQTGAVIFTSKTRNLGENAESVIEACPYNIPRLDTETGLLTKCHMCHTRIQEGLVPICAKTCPTGAINFGNEKEIKDLARGRLATARRRFGDETHLINPDDVRAIYLIAASADKYNEYAEF